MWLHCTTNYTVDSHHLSLSSNFLLTRVLYRQLRTNEIVIFISITVLILHKMFRETIKLAINDRKRRNFVLCFPTFARKRLTKERRETTMLSVGYS